jgi:hypothetical protein
MLRVDPGILTPEPRQEVGPVEICPLSLGAEKET